MASSVLIALPVGPGRRAGHEGLLLGGYLTLSSNEAFLAYIYCVFPMIISTRSWSVGPSFFLSLYYLHSHYLFLLQKFVDDDTSSKRQNKALQYDTDEDESMKSDSEENIDEDSDEVADKQEGYGSRKEKAGKKLSEVKESPGKKKSNIGSGHKSGPPNKIIKNLVKKVSTKIHEEKESPNDSAKVFIKL
jgi:hypothetical protein